MRLGLMGERMRRLKGIDWGKRDFISAFLLLALSFFICSFSLLTLSYGYYNRPGSGFLPFWSGFVLGVMSLGLLVKSIWRNKEIQRSVFHGFSNRHLYTILALIAYCFFFYTLGYILLNFLFMTFMLMIVERKKWYIALGGGLITALGFYLVFSIWMHVPLPLGIFY